MSDKEVKTACWAPDVKDIQISAQNTLPHSFQITGDTRVWKKKQNSCYTVIVLWNVYILPLRLVEHHERMVIEQKKKKKVSQLGHQVTKGILKKAKMWYN